MIIASITGPTMDAALGQMRASSRYASALELRLDLIDHYDLQRLVHASSRPLVATCRPEWEGGAFQGNEEDRLDRLAEAASCGVGYLDLEAKLGVKAVRTFKRSYPRTKIIVSRHLFGGERPDPVREFTFLRSFRADAVKLAFEASDGADTALVFDFLRRASTERVKAVGIAMGEAGEPSRILYRKFGGWATYAAPEGGPAAAPGQLSARVLKTVYHADELRRSTRVFGLIGDPVRYSKGVYLFNPLFQRAGYNAVYCRFQVAALKEFMERVAPFMAGFSVTAPHKQEVIAYLVRTDETARGIGAVNTLVRRRNGLEGFNTDAPGALDAIERRMKVKGKQVLLLGAGGAARAIAWEAVRRGARLLLANRTQERAEELAAAVGARTVTLEDVTAVDVIINSTTIGMAPGIDGTPIAAGSIQARLAFDAVYAPLETRFLREARASGMETVSGIEMYINQAARQFHLFTGRTVSPAAFRRLLAHQQR